jgi:TATA-binding protein-associated factor Taf7
MPWLIHLNWVNRRAVVVARAGQRMAAVVVVQNTCIEVQK